MASNKKSFLTGIPDIDREILLRTPDAQLFPACLASSYTQQLCNETFWRNKFIREFGTDLGQYANKSYQKLYKDLRLKSNDELLYISGKQGYLPLIKSLVETAEETGLDIHANNEGAFRAAAWNGARRPRSSGPLARWASFGCRKILSRTWRKYSYRR